MAKVLIINTDCCPDYARVTSTSLGELQDALTFLMGELEEWKDWDNGVQLTITVGEMSEEEIEALEPLG